MKRLVLDLRDDLHRHLVEGAVDLGRSLDSVTIEILETAVRADLSDRRQRLRQKAALLGINRTYCSTTVDSATRREIIDSTREFGPTLDR